MSGFSALPGLMKNVAVFVIATVLTLVIAESIFRLVKTPISGWELKQLWHPELFTVETPGISWTKHTDEFETRITVNAHGFRDPPFPPTTDRLFIGDSMTAAHQVDEDKRFCALLHGVCLGMNGADPIQELQFYRKVGRALQPKIVVHQVFMFNDIVEGGEYLTIKNGRIDTMTPQKPKEPLCMKFWNIKSYFLMRICEFVRFQLTKTPETYGILEQKKDLNLTRITIQTFKEEVEHDGGRYILLMIPHPKEIEGMTELHDNLLAELSDIEIIDPIEDFRASSELLYFQHDGHLTEAGHRFIARLILRHLSNPLHKNPLPSTLD